MRGAAEAAPGRLARNAAEVNSWPALFAEGAVVGVNNEFVRLLVRNETSSLDRFGFGVVSGAGVAADLDLPLVAGWDYVHVCYWGLRWSLMARLPGRRRRLPKRAHQRRSRFAR